MRVTKEGDRTIAFHCGERNGIRAEITVPVRQKHADSAERFHTFVWLAVRVIAVPKHSIAGNAKLRSDLCTVRREVAEVKHGVDVFQTSLDKREPGNGAMRIGKDGDLHCFSFCRASSSTGRRGVV